MDNLWTALILGIVEGLTEFLPVSSTGHLIIAGHLMGFHGEKEATFEVVIQLGAILAVAVLYRERFLMLLRPDPERSFSGVRGLWLLFLTSAPAAAIGLVAHETIKTRLFNPVTVAWALGVGALAILAVESFRRRKRFSSLDELTPAAALGIGFFQAVSLWPGFSRAAATIMGGMLLGCERRLAAEYSFIAAVPIMVAATGFDMLSSLHLFTWGDFPFMAVGFVVSFFAAWAAVKGFISLLQRVTLRPFAYYRLAIAPLVLIFWV